MSIYLQLLLLAWVVVFIVDLSGVTYELARWLRRERLRKPWSCSLCMTWWTGLVWAVATGSLSVPVVAYVAALAWGSSILRGLAVAVFDILQKLINKIS